jgi:uncharacterized protein (DUF779 family)
MQMSSSGIDRPRGGFRRRLLVTVRARRALRDLVAASGPQHVIVCWPAGATTLPATMHLVGPHEAVVGHVAGCPIYVDLRQVCLFRNRQALLDVPEPARHNCRPRLRLRTVRLMANP